MTRQVDGKRREEQSRGKSVVFKERRARSQSSRFALLVRVGSLFRFRPTLLQSVSPELMQGRSASFEAIVITTTTTSFNFLNSYTQLARIAIHHPCRRFRTLQSLRAQTPTPPGSSTKTFHPLSFKARFRSSTLPTRLSMVLSVLLPAPTLPRAALVNPSNHALLGVQLHCLMGTAPPKTCQRCDCLLDSTSTMRTSLLSPSAPLLLALELVDQGSPSLQSQAYPPT